MAPEGAREGIRFNDRSIVLGRTGSGKSEILNVQFSGIRCQRLLFDTKDEWTIAEVEPVSDPEAIDWTAPTIHYVTSGDDVDQADQVFGRVLVRRRPIVVCVHELGDLCDFLPNKTPPGLRGYLSKGRAHGMGLLGASQRPVEMPVRAKSEAEHVFVSPQLTRGDLEVVSTLTGADPKSLAEDLVALSAEHGDFAFLWFDTRARKVTRCPPLPDHVRKRSVVKKSSRF